VVAVGSGALVASAALVGSTAALVGSTGAVVGVAAGEQPNRPVKIETSKRNDTNLCFIFYSLLHKNSYMVRPYNYVGKA
jgi:hypothetical protein